MIMAKYTVEDSFTINIAQLKHRVLNGWEGIPQPILWGDHPGDNITADALYRIIDDGADQSYLDIHMTRYGHQTDYSFNQRINLDTSLIPNNATRWWLICPKCGERRSTLHLPPDGDRFLCRTCNNLTYRSCQESRRWDKLYRYIANHTGQELYRVKHALNSMVF